MPQTIRFALVLHNHQPVGNFDGVFEAAYHDSYLPFLDVFEPFDNLRIALHTSGSLMQWLDRAHPEYIQRLAGLVARGRIEIIGGAFFEPILTMIPARDRIGQIRRYTDWLTDRLGADVRGMWVPERVWEQSLAADIVDAGIEFTMLDDFHFKSAGLDADALHGYYVSEDAGRVLKIFPGDEQMRYLIPFADPEKTIERLREIAAQQPGAMVTFADDGEKFGTWPETKKHVYDDLWLRRFFELLDQNSEWIHVTTPGEAVDNVAPQGSIYLPDCSYREMTEWALPTTRLMEYEELRRDLERDPRWPEIAKFMRGGFWRNFKAKYAESNEMYARMMRVSERLAAAERTGPGPELIDRAREQLYQGQCNCSYWHGAFGGLYLPHLRNAIYHHLIRAENVLDEAAGRHGGWVDAEAGDLNFDARQEVCLSNDKLLVFAAPATGGMLYELDVRAIAHNLLATMQRRPEAYHAKVLGGAKHEGNGAASIHDRVVCKQEGLHERVQYDHHLRKMLIDHFYPLDADLQQVAGGTAEELGDFVHAAFEARLRRNPDRIQLQMIREGIADGAEVRITKGVTIEAGSPALEIAYYLENLPGDRPLHFGCEFNLAGLPAQADDRYFYAPGSDHLGHLGTWLDLPSAESIGLVDHWLGIDVQLAANRPAGIWTFPIETVSQSEGGFELVHQSVVLQPHWIIQPTHDRTWSVTMKLLADTSEAESRSTAATEPVAT